MSDKQRADHVQAKYWNGFITRTEAQKVFDEQGQVITAQAMAIQKLDSVISFMVEKFGVTIDDINKWIMAKQEAMQAAVKVQPVQQPPQEAAPNSSPIVLTD